MTNAEITAYEYGRRLARAAMAEVSDDTAGTTIAASLMTGAEQASLDRLGLDAWWAQVQKGGNEVLEAHGVVRPVQA